MSVVGTFLAFRPVLYCDHLVEREIVTYDVLVVYLDHLRIDSRRFLSDPGVATFLEVACQGKELRGILEDSCWLPELVIRVSEVIQYLWDRIS